jgi:hypothetical protein
VTVTFAFFDCVTVNSDSYVRTYPSISCSSDEYTFLVPVFYTILFAIVVGVPLAVFAALWINHRRGLLYDEKHMRRYGSLFDVYKKSRFWYESLVLLRRIAIIAVAVRVPDRTLRYSWLTVLNIFFLYVRPGARSRPVGRFTLLPANLTSVPPSSALLPCSVFHVGSRPYLLWIDNVIETGALTVLSVITLWFITAQQPLDTDRQIGLVTLVFAVMAVFVLKLVASRSAKILTALTARDEPGHRGSDAAAAGLLRGKSELELGTSPKVLGNGGGGSAGGSSTASPVGSPAAGLAVAPSGAALPPPLQTDPNGPIHMVDVSALIPPTPANGAGAGGSSGAGGGVGAGTAMPVLDRRVTPPAPAREVPTSPTALSGLMTPSVVREMSFAERMGVAPMPVPALLPPPPPPAPPGPLSSSSEAAAAVDPTADVTAAPAVGGVDAVPAMAAADEAPIAPAL